MCGNGRGDGGRQIRVDNGGPVAPLPNREINETPRATAPRALSILAGQLRARQTGLVSSIAAHCGSAPRISAGPTCVVILAWSTEGGYKRRRGLPLTSSASPCPSRSADILITINRTLSSLSAPFSHTDIAVKMQRSDSKNPGGASDRAHGKPSSSSKSGAAPANGRTMSAPAAPAHGRGGESSTHGGHAHGSNNNGSAVSPPHARRSFMPKDSYLGPTFVEEESVEHSVAYLAAARVSTLPSGPYYSSTSRQQPVHGPQQTLQDLMKPAFALPGEIYPAGAAPPKADPSMESVWKMLQEPGDDLDPDWK
ncbi:hypothetical protein K488DRAFT_92058 [Vararia minispora EC-137]|uniref:Uncharacterized protein n=1 Tax=Vararia minispora EC-137 TaxID=1314806 RepID=A0ACB8Q4T2_9AGAM|nr:hypothetical protein K488DRAFT_92058 [Vararia minispora EC-137]